MIQVLGMDAEAGKVYTSQNVLDSREIKREMVRARNHHRVLDIMVITPMGSAMYSHVGGGVWKWQ